MGKSNEYITPFYNDHIKPKADTALLGFSDNSIFNGDLYDKSLNNWNINNTWSLNKNYDTIICTRCAYFAKDPGDFILRCHNHLNEGGVLYVDWGLGDHWRFPNYKIGWVKDGEHEHAYGKDNLLWSTIWSDEFLQDEQFQLFENRVYKFGYKNLKEAIFKEVPEILKLSEVAKIFDISYNILSLWDDMPQLYILLECKKKDIKNDP